MERQAETRRLDDFQLRTGDALIVVDVQNDFLPGGKLAVTAGDEVVPALNEYQRRFVSRGLPIFATRDWHPTDHCSFTQRGGRWPAHCVAGTPGAEFAAGLLLPAAAVVISKATLPEAEAYSAFAGGDLAQRLRRAGVGRLFVGGLATDYCVLETVRDGLAEGFAVVLLVDAVRAVSADDGARAVAQMSALGAGLACLGEAR
ncbi:MAG TPA: isochorismatase family protein [Accumulibacter sp.]|uniref:isochorismatase family protein n=1 Tax=Accumulibacter sp. TaxID=2053492 RepID=UPI0025D3D7A1|nr:isochorismatase family protein [Accumulibacter sp.]MCM8599202.1 isochorismatase family protein [Accumulibacter sp.]MCM8662890.1 isochorismatase family protein [Accumulibacter sp.]HNC52801.1 isochorismatase family protein [Accumulibacter sp.]